MQMPIHFKGITEYQSKFKGQRMRSRSVSPQHSMVPQAGLRSHQLGIIKEPQFLSKKRAPFYRPQVSKCLQWVEPVDLRMVSQEQAVRRRSHSHSPKRYSSLPDKPEKQSHSPEKPSTPLAPRRPRPPENQLAEPKLGALSQPPPPDTKEPKLPTSAVTVDQAEPAVNGVQHVLKRKAKLKCASRKSGHLASEYQRQFSWKTSVASSPLLAAEQVVYSSSGVVPPFKANPVALESEYRRNFKGRQAPRGPRLRRDVEDGQGMLLQLENVSPDRVAKSKRKRKKKKRNQSVKKPILQKGTLISARDRTPQEMTLLKPQWPSTCQPAYRNVKSEYNSNFCSPLMYKYKDGAWFKSSTPGEEGCDNDHNHLWYNEVRELRDKAECYRKRAWGTHFSREHLNQILSEQNRLWEASTVSSSADTRQSSNGCKRALDLPRTQSVRGSPEAPASPPSSKGGDAEDGIEGGLHNVPTLPLHRKMAWVEAEKGDATEIVGGAWRQQQGEESDGGDQEEDVEAEHNDKDIKHQLRPKEKRHLSPESGSERSGQEGRLPTPKLKTITAVQRTHYDLTTPATGGALLVSPPMVKGPQPSVRRCEPPLGKPCAPFKHVSQSTGLQNPGKVDESTAQVQSQAAGLNTLDPIPLREDAWETDPNPTDGASPCHTRLTHKHSAVTYPSVTVSASRIQGSLRDPEFQHNGNLGVTRPEIFVFSRSDTATSDDDDRMSQISSRSAASCSLASQVLARAQKRKDDFWGKSLRSRTPASPHQVS